MIEKYNAVMVLFQSFLRKAPSEKKDPRLQDGDWAILMLFQHHLSLFYHERGRYEERLRKLEEAMTRTIAPGDACPPPPM